VLRHRADGKKIQILRDARDWTQEQLAYIAGYSIKTIWKAEASGELKRQTLNDIAIALGVELSDIVANPEGLLPTRKEEVNKNIVLETLSAFPEQDLKALMDRMHRDAVFEHPAPPVIPEAGTYHGHNEVRKYFSRAFLQLPWDQFENQHLVAEGEFVDWHTQAIHCSSHTGRSFPYFACFHFRLLEGRIIHFRHYQDYSGLLLFYEENGWPHWRR
jgi:ketosteroid isomerase-like protein/DNA-binding XRE family transcriptional regulator